MVARLFVRLLAVLAFVFAMSVAQPAYATALTVDSVTCVITGYYAPDPTHYGTYSCTANASGGTGTYTNYRWTVFTWCCGDPYFGSGQTVYGNCAWGTYRFHNVTVTDSSGATAGGAGNINCAHP